MSLRLIINAFSKTKVLLIGDLMLDKYVFGNIERISPEAPVPVFLSKKKNAVLGGSGNVFNNLASLGANVTFLSVLGKDLVAKEIKNNLKKNKTCKYFLYEEKNFISTSKTRYLSNNQQIIRVDEEQRDNISSEAEKFLFQVFKKEIVGKDVIVISDYNKGVITNLLCKKIISLAKKKKIPVVVDPKNKNFNIYRNSTLITPNQMEASKITQLNCSTDKEAERCAKHIAEHYCIENVMITRGEKGLTFYSKNSVMHSPTEKIEVYDVSGAGDTVIAVVSICLANSVALGDMLSLANKAAGIVVGKIGTTTIKKNDLLNKNKINLPKKQINLKNLLNMVENDKKKGLKIGFTNGCFDIIHSGHIAYLKSSKQLCDKLIVAINSDFSVRKIKGKNRPLNSQNKRALVLEALSFTDYIIVFNELNPIKLIKQIKPDLITKGGDYKNTKIIGENEVKKWGGKSYILEHVKGESTTKILERNN